MYLNQHGATAFSKFKISKNNLFKPAWWLSGAHAQTIWPVLSRRKITLDLNQERIELNDGDFIDLVWVKPAQSYPKQPIVVILHGLTGSIASRPVSGLLNACNQAGWRALLMYFRGCNGIPNRLQRSHHAGATDDLAFIIQTLQQREPATPIAVVGISLGGNVLLKWLGETGQDNPLFAAVAISVPFELAQAATCLNSGFSRLYQWWLLKKLRQDTVQKFKALNNTRLSQYLQWINTYRTFWEFDSKITAPLNGFSNVHEYYRQCSCRPFIKFIHTPTLIVHALDDPFISNDAIPQAGELSTSVCLQLSKSGGHAGFIQGAIPGKAEYWLEHRIPQYLTSVQDKEYA